MVNETIKKEIRKYFEFNDNENRSKTVDTTKVALRRKFIALNF